MSTAGQITPKLSAFEILLARVYAELWERQDDDVFVIERVYRFTKTFFPFKDKLVEKIGDFNAKLAKMEANVGKLQQMKNGADSLTAEVIDESLVPSEEADFAWDVMGAAVEVLTEEGFNYSIYSSVGFFDPSGGKKSGTGQRGGFARTLPGKI